MRRRSTRTQTPGTLRRSSRLRHLYSLSEETDYIEIGTSEDQSLKEKEDDKGTAEKKTEGEEREETRKAGKPSSRIPTFQSSLARRRTTTQIAESQLPSKSEVSSRECQMKESGIGPGETSQTKLLMFGDRETALPILSTRIHSYSTDDLSVAGTSDPIQSETLEVTSLPHEGNHSPEPSDPEELEESLHRPSVRVKTGSHDTASASEHTVEPQDESTEFLSKDEQDSDTVIQDDPKQILSEVIQGIGEELEERLVKEIPAASVIEDFPKQCLSLKETKKHPADASNDVPARSKAVHSRQAEKTPRTSSGTRGRSFALFCIFPSVLLLLVGFGQHIWLYGVPRSVSHLMVQLELHWLEGFWLPQEECSSDCRLTLTESIPEGMLFPAGSPHLQSTMHTWTNLLNRANSSVSIAAFYLTLRDSDIGLTDPSAVQGKVLLDHLKQLKSRGVNLKIAVNAPQTYTSDTDELTGTGAEVREVDLKNITGGVVHTKLWVVDKRHMYVGSANMDWRSLTQVKEMGVSVEDCSCLAQDALRIFEVYWELGAQKNSLVPPYWPGRFSALSSIKYPLTVKFNGVPARVYLSSTPPQLSTFGRTDDLSAILSVIADAKKFIYVSVMDYLPMSQFTTEIRFWPAIDSALREAACARKVEVNLLVSCWSHSPETMFIFLQSLSVLSKTPLECNIHIKFFEVPYMPAQHRIPFARVNHAKYMVTDRVVYIGTSNWSQNYFTQTAGVGLVVNQTASAVEKGQQTVQNQLQKIFQRDWNSDFAQALTDDLVEHCSRRETTL